MGAHTSHFCIQFFLSSKAQASDLGFCERGKSGHCKTPRGGRPKVRLLQQHLQIGMGCAAEVHPYTELSNDQATITHSSRPRAR